MKDHILSINEVVNTELNLDVIESLHGGPVYPGLLNMDDLAEKPMSITEINNTMMNIDMLETMRGVPVSKTVEAMRWARTKAYLITYGGILILFGILYLVALIGDF